MLEHNKIIVSNILYRTLIEAFIEYFYVLNKFKHEKEKFSEEYLLARLAYERLEKEKVNVKINNNFNTLINVDKKNIVEKPTKNKKFITSETYNKRNENFSLKIKFLYQIDPMFNKENGSISLMLEKYNYLSSFVHVSYGGLQKIC
jgi:hypothetical protein